jgi:N-acetylmuramoyl-L-alanine amidase
MPTPGQQYTIQAGDTLFSIATAAYGAAGANAGVTAIETANPGIVPTQLQVGQQISIPSLSAPTQNQQYTVQSGDTLFSIASHFYGPANATVGVTAIETANPGIVPTQLRVGQQVTIPAHP